jgi:hypothetical protein
MKLILSQVVPVAPFHVVNADKKRIIHDPHPLQEFHVAPQLFREQGSLLGTEFEGSTTIDPVQIFQDSLWIRFRLVLGIFSAESGTFEIISLMDIAMRGEEVVHDYKVDFAPARELDSMQAVEAGQESMRIGSNVLMIVLENRAQKLVLGVRDGLDDKAVIPREIEERA